MSNLRNLFWVLSLGLIAAYLFFWILGAYSLSDVWPISLVVGVLIVLWAFHAWNERRNREKEDVRDEALMRARERRGF